MTPSERRAARLEDAAWLAETGVGLTEAAARMGMTRKALADLLRRHAPDTQALLLAHEPRDWNDPRSLSPRDDSTDWSKVYAHLRRVTGSKRTLGRAAPRRDQIRRSDPAA